MDKKGYLFKESDVDLYPHKRHILSLIAKKQNKLVDKVKFVREKFYQ